jgi:hypothetical protein
MLAAAEHQVFQEVRKTGFARLFVRETDTIADGLAGGLGKGLVQRSVECFGGVFSVVRSGAKTGVFPAYKYIESGGGK